MNKRLSIAMFLVMIGAISASSVSAEDTMKVVEKRIEASWAKVRSLSARTMFETLDIGSEVKLTSQYTGVYWHIKRDGKELYRYDVSSILTVSSGEESREQPTQKHVLVGDGDYVYNQTEIYGMPVADKINQLESGIGMGGKNLLDYIKLDQYKLTFLHSEKINGKSVFVIEGVHAQVGRERSMLLYISKESGMLVQRETYLNDKINSRLTITDIDLNEDIPSDIFEARPSKDIGIVDKTGKKAVMP